jgi:hypothetical protein
MSARCGIANALFDGGNPVLRNGAAENVIHKFNAFAALKGFKLDAAYAELAVSAGLFLVLAFRVRLPTDGFAVRNLGRLEGEVDVVTLLELGNDNFDMLLAIACE